MPLFATSLSPDGAWLAHVSGFDKPTLTVYDLLGDGTPISHQILAAGPLGTVGQRAPFAFSPDGRWPVFLDPSDRVGLWPGGNTAAASDDHRARVAQPGRVIGRPGVSSNATPAVTGLAACRRETRDVLDDR
jgi:hypothetical protein